MSSLFTTRLSNYLTIYIYLDQSRACNVRQPADGRVVMVNTVGALLSAQLSYNLQSVECDR